MRAHEVEAWALRVIDDALSGRPDEDARVELKSQWPSDPADTARKIAGHANASHGASILWLIGVDQKGKKVIGAERKDIADWYQQVKHSFDGVAPELFDYNVPYGNYVVVALLFETDRIPFVVKNPKGGQVTREVPWREGTKLDSITRENLIQLLAPTQQYPNFDILSAELSIRVTSDKNWQGIFKLEVYAETTSTNRVTIPYHKCKPTLSTNAGEVLMSPEDVSLTPATTNKETLRSQTITSTLHDITLTGPGYIILDGSFTCAREFLESHSDNVPDLFLHLTMWPIQALHPLHIRCPFSDGVYTGHDFVWKGQNKAMHYHQWVNMS